MRSFLIITIFLSLAISEQVLAASQRPPLSGISNQKTIDRQELDKISQKGTENAPFVVKVIPTPIDPAKAQRNEEGRQNKEVREDIALVIAGLTAFILIGQTCYFRKQAIRLKETIDEMKVATTATKEAADAAKKAPMLPK